MTHDIPEGFQSVTPSLNVKDAAKAIELYKKAFNAKELYRMDHGDSGKIMHACIEIDNSKLFLSDVQPGKSMSEPTSAMFYVYVDDVDSMFKQAKQAGLSEMFAVEDMFWGDRTGCLQDGFGNTWTLATHVREVSPEEMEEGKRKFEQKMAA